MAVLTAPTITPTMVQAVGAIGTSVGVGIEFGYGWGLIVGGVLTILAGAVAEALPSAGDPASDDDEGVL